jgi:hypothetical protein
VPVRGGPDLADEVSWVARPVFFMLKARGLAPALVVHGFPLGAGRWG